MTADSVVAIGCAVLATVLAGALLGLLAGHFLPEQHRSSETRSVVSVSMAVLGTLSALVVGLLISNASDSLSKQSQEVTEMSADIIRLDRVLRRFGPAAEESRATLHRYAAAKVEDLFPAERAPPMVDNNATFALLEALQDQVLALVPADEAGRWLREHALDLTTAMSQIRWLLAEQQTAAIPSPFLALMVFWLTVVFASYGLFSPRNTTAVAALVICAVAVSGAVTMILDMQTPFGGVIRISSAPMRHALATIGP